MNVNNMNSVGSSAYTPPRLDEILVAVEHGFANSVFDDGELDGSQGNELPGWE